MSKDVTDQKHLNALLQISLAINDSLELPDVLTQVVYYTRTLIGCDHAVILLWDGKRGQFEGEVSTASEQILNTGNQTGAISAHWAIDKGEAKIVDFLGGEKNKEAPIQPSPPTQTYAWAPIRHAGIGLGILYALYHQPQKINGDTPAILEALANIAAIAIRNAKLVGSLRQSGELRHAIIQIATNDINYPLQKLTKSVQNLISQIPSPANKNSEAIDSIQTALFQMEQLTQTLDKYNRLVVTSEYETFPCDLNHLAQQVVREFQESVARKSIPLQIELSRRQLMIYGDQIALRDAIGALARDVINNTPPGKSLRFCTSFDQDHFIVRVMGSHLSYSSEQLDKLFRRFANPMETTHLGEDELSFFLVWRILEQHEATLLSEVSPDNHMAYSIYFPAEKQ